MKIVVITNTNARIENNPDVVTLVDKDIQFENAVLVEFQGSKYFKVHQLGRNILIPYYDAHSMYTDEELAEKLVEMKEAKRDNYNKARRLADCKHFNMHQKVYYKTSNRDGTVITNGVGIIEDNSYRNYLHVKYLVRDLVTNVVHEVVLGHPDAWYASDEIVPMDDEIESQHNYFAVYDQRENKVNLDSIYKYKADTEGYLRSMVGEPAPPYLQVRSIQIVVL